LRRAIEWAFEGDYSAEPSVSLVESFIALEALLGDEKEKVGQSSDRLADRYALLVGTTVTERTRSRAEFKRLYDERNRVVHGNQRRADLAHDFSSRYETIGMTPAAITEEARRYLKAHGQALARALSAPPKAE
jgi:hypothetical protein